MSRNPSSILPTPGGGDEDPVVAATKETVLLDIDGNTWTIGDAIEGTQIFGATGSGKTTGSGAMLANRFLDKQCGNFGGLVLTAKPEELKTWERYLARAKREQDKVVFDPKSGYQFNFLDYEFNRPDDPSADGKRLTLNIVSLFMATLSTGETGANTDPYWNDALRELLTHTIDLADMGCGELELPDLAEIIRSAPQSKSELRSPTWQKSRCFELLQAACADAERLKEENPDRYGDLVQTVAYWLGDFPNLSDRTRSIIVSSFTGKTAGLLRSPLRRMFCTKATPETDKVRPTETHKGKIIIVNLPVKEYGEVGRFAQIIYKTVWQRATERRQLTGEWRPVFLWADEAQYFVTQEDMLFQQTARSKMAATVYLTQNLPNYHAALGSRNGNAATESLMGNLQTKIFHANGDPATNEWAERLFGKWVAIRGGDSQNTGGTTPSQTSESHHDNIEPIVWANDFAALQTGGPAHDFTVDAFIYKAGRIWKENGEEVRKKIFEFPQYLGK